LSSAATPAAWSFTGTIVAVLQRALEVGGLGRPDEKHDRQSERSPLDHGNSSPPAGDV
jgi:hypothetical protein